MGATLLQAAIVQKVPEGSSTGVRRSRNEGQIEGVGVHVELEIKAVGAPRLVHIIQNFGKIKLCFKINHAWHSHFI